MRPGRSALPVATLCVALTVTGALFAGPRPASAGVDPSPEAGETTTSTPPAPNIIPEPNSGQAPEDAGDRGGSLQVLVFVIVLGGIALIGFLVVRESRKAREGRGF